MAKELKEKEVSTNVAKRKTLSDLFHEPCAVKIDHALMHQSFEIYGAGQSSTLSGKRPGLKDLEIVYHPGYGLIGKYNGKFFLAPSANVVVAHENERAGQK